MKTPSSLSLFVYQRDCCICKVLQEGRVYLSGSYSSIHVKVKYAKMSNLDDNVTFYCSSMGYLPSRPYLTILHSPPYNSTQQ